MRPQKTVLLAFLSAWALSTPTRQERPTLHQPLPSRPFKAPLPYSPARQDAVEPAEPFYAKFTRKKGKR